MKKTSKLFGAIALSATLAMGAIPAFAADTVGATEDIESTEDDVRTLDTDVDGGAGSPDSIITVSTFTSQISVTLPVALPIVADTAGGAGMAPNNYGFTNNSVPDIQVTNATWEVVDDAKAKWNLGTQAFDSMGAKVVNYKTDDAQTETAPSMGSLHIVLTPGTVADGAWAVSPDATPLAIAGSAKATLTSPAKGAELDWMVYGSETVAADTTKSTTQLLQVLPTSSVIAGQQDATDVVKVTYTVKLAG